MIHPTYTDVVRRVHVAEQQMHAITLAMQQTRDLDVLRALIGLRHDAELDVLRAENARLHMRLTKSKERRR